jgi:hypothetical protein
LEVEALNLLSPGIRFFKAIVMFLSTEAGLYGGTRTVCHGLWLMLVNGHPERFADRVRGKFVEEARYQILSYFRMSSMLLSGSCDSDLVTMLPKGEASLPMVPDSTKACKAWHRACHTALPIEHSQGLNALNSNTVASFVLNHAGRPNGKDGNFILDEVPWEDE